MKTVIDKPSVMGALPEESFAPLALHFVQEDFPCAIHQNELLPEVQKYLFYPFTSLRDDSLEDKRKLDRSDWYVFNDTCSLRLLEEKLYNSFLRSPSAVKVCSNLCSSPDLSSSGVGPDFKASSKGELSLWRLHKVRVTLTQNRHHLLETPARHIVFNLASNGLHKEASAQNSTAASHCLRCFTYWSENWKHVAP